MLKVINKIKNRKGFTLIELIVVLAVLAIIMAIAVPRFLGVQEEAKKNADVSTAAMMAKAAELYVVSENKTTTDGDTSVTVALLTASGKYMESTAGFDYYTGTVVITMNKNGECTAITVGSKALYPKPAILPEL